MYLANVTNGYDNITDYDIITFTSCTNTDNEDVKKFFKYLLLSIPSSIIIFSLISLMVHTLIKHLLNNK